MTAKLIYSILFIFLTTSFFPYKNNESLHILAKNGHVYINGISMPQETTKDILDSAIGYKGIWKKGKKIKGLKPKVLGSDFLAYDNSGLVATKCATSEILTSITVRFSDESIHMYGKDKMDTKNIFIGTLTIDSFKLNASTTLQSLKSESNCSVEGNYINGIALSNTLTCLTTSIHMHFNPKSGNLIDATVMLIDVKE